MASGMARGAHARGKRIAFGDGARILWDHHSEEIFRKNPNVAPPGAERDGDLEWIPFYRGNRLYNRQQANRWLWNENFKAIPGEIYLNDDDKAFGRAMGHGFVVIEPNVPKFKAAAPNKQWPIRRYQEVALWLEREGIEVVQFKNGGLHTIHNARMIETKTFRQALAVMACAQLYIGAEGGLHHGAAAVDIPGVVLFGGFIPPTVTGYDTHINLTGGAVACGSLSRCMHCEQAMDKISTELVIESAQKLLRKLALAGA
jgi:ADP-heptose:LPS heptosyltransferase